MILPSSGLGRVRQATHVLFGEPRLRALLVGCVFLGLTSSFVMPYMSMFGTLEIGLSLPAFSAFMTTTMLSNVIISSLLARWSDRLPTRRVVLLLGSSAGVLGYIGYALLREVWQLLMVGTLLLSVASLTFSQLFAHARECIDRSDVPSADAPLYMNGFRMAFAASWTLGPALAALALAQLHFRGLFLCAAAFYLVFVLIVLRYVPAQPMAHAARAVNTEGIGESVVDAPAPVALASLWSQPNLAGWFAAFVLMFAAQAISMSNMSLYVLHELGGTEKDVGLIFGIAPVFEVPCMLYLGLLATRVDSAHLIRGAMALGAIYFGAVSLVHAPWQIYPLQLLSAIIVAIISGIAITFFQNKLPGQFGTATNFYMNANRIGSTSGFLLFGALASRFGHRGAYVACSVLALTALLGTRVLVREAVVQG
jgi:MFS transporter, SET family, sugar efflux transporter